MSFLNPLWLLGLIPWLGLTLWLLLGRRERANVPFLPLWHGPAEKKPLKREWKLPPLALAAAIAAILFALIAAAGPAVWGHAKGTNITLIVDRGMSMSATDGNGQPRFIETSQRAAQAIEQFAPASKIDLQIIPGPMNRQDAGSQWIDLVKSISPTALDDPAAVHDAVRAALANTTGLVVVISDQTLDLHDPRLVQFSPQNGVSNVGIVTLAVRASPKPAAMVRVRNQSSLTSCPLLLQSDNQTITTTISLPPNGQEKDYFFDLPAAGQIVQASLQANDDLPADHHAWAVRQAAWPIVEAHSTLPAELQRMIDVYSRRRLPGEGSAHIAVVLASDVIPPGRAALVASPGDAVHPVDAQSMVVAADPPIAKGVDWVTALKDANSADLPPGDWAPIVTAGGRPVVVIREQPVRQVWVGFTSATFARTPDFVLFWNNIFQWLGDGGDAYASSVVSRLNGRWTRRQPANPTLAESDLGLQPGLYQDADGAMLAINAPAIPIPPPPATDGAARLGTFQTHASKVDLSSPAILLALMLMMISTLLWVKR